MCNRAHAGRVETVIIYQPKRLSTYQPIPLKSYSIMWTRSQSGQIQVGPLLMPHLFSAKHCGQI